MVPYYETSIKAEKQPDHKRRMHKNKIDSSQENEREKSNKAISEDEDDLF